MWGVCRIQGERGRRGGPPTSFHCLWAGLSAWGKEVGPQVVPQATRGETLSMRSSDDVAMRGPAGTWPRDAVANARGRI